jgi:FMN-dependent oxidoreductase (nitrilotriacetate monooxygenase family)
MEPTLKLALDLSFTHTEGAWRNPGSWVNYPYYTQPAIWEDVARTAERGCIDMVFFGDGVGIPDTWEGSIDAAVKWGLQWPRHDMSPTIALMSRVTKHLGFGLTFSPTYMHPYYVARHVASLDHVTGGRMALNLVTSARRSDAANFGFDELMEHDQRYERADEFIDVLKGLWSTIEPDAIVLDRQTGVFADPAKVHYLDHVGEFFNVKGPLNMQPAPQYHPPLIQAGASPRGMKSFARNADIVFVSRPTAAGMVKFRASLDSHLAEVGRTPEEIQVLWPVHPMMGESVAHAKELEAQLIESVPLEAGGVFMSHKSGFDFSTLPETFTVAEATAAIEAANGSTAYLPKMAEMVGPDGVLTKKMFQQLGRETMIAGGPTLYGTGKDIADQICDLHAETGPNVGFMISIINFMPRNVVDFVEKVVPILQQRGVFKTDYGTNKTLRDNLGVPLKRWTTPTAS